jgi:K+-transporting ATPase ATPase C chain
VGEIEAMMFRQIRISLVLFCGLTLITGIFYPLVVTGFAQFLFSEKANGSLIRTEGKLLGSEFIGQPFKDPKYFWGRPSATSPFPYNAAASSGSNYGPLHKELLAAVQEQAYRLHTGDSLKNELIPVDLVTASGSGLDPHISIEAALFQIHRVASSRKMSDERVRSFVKDHTENRQFGFLGEPRVNVLKLNLALDDFQSEQKEKK